VKKKLIEVALPLDVINKASVRESFIYRGNPSALHKWWDASKVADEVITHLAGLLGAQVKVTLEIEADVPAGVPENVVRTVTENSRTLKFDTTRVRGRVSGENMQGKQDT